MRLSCLMISKDCCADQNDGIRMDATVEGLWAEWKAKQE